MIRRRRRQTGWRRAARWVAWVAAVAGTLALPWWQSTTRWVEYSAVPWLALLVAWTVGLVVARRRAAAVAAIVVLVATVAGGAAVATVVGPLRDPVVTASPVDLSLVRDATYFRSCDSNDFSGRSVDDPGTVERDRNMRHVLVLSSLHRDAEPVPVVAPFDGVVTRTEDGTRWQSEDGWVDGLSASVSITGAALPLLGSWSVTLGRVAPTVEPGDRVRAGDVVGYAPQAQWPAVRSKGPDGPGLASSPVAVEVVLRWNPPLPNGEYLASYLRYLDPGLADAHRGAGFDPVLGEIARTARDAAPCDGRFNADPAADYYRGDEWRRESMQRFGDGREWGPCTGATLGREAQGGGGTWRCVRTLDGALAWATADR